MGVVFQHWARAGSSKLAGFFVVPGKSQHALAARNHEHVPMHDCFDKEHDVLRINLRGVVHNELPRVSAAQYGILMAW